MYLLQHHGTIYGFLKNYWVLSSSLINTAENPIVLNIIKMPNTIHSNMWYGHSRMCLSQKESVLQWSKLQPARLPTGSQVSDEDRIRHPNWPGVFWEGGCLRETGTAARDRISDPGGGLDKELLVLVPHPAVDDEVDRGVDNIQEASCAP